MAADGSSPQLITEVDDKPLAPITTALLREAQASQPFFVTELKTPRALHLAFAAAAGGKNGTYVAYAEEPLPANRRITRARRLPSRIAEPRGVSRPFAGQERAAGNELARAAAAERDDRHNPDPFREHGPDDHDFPAGITARDYRRNPAIGRCRRRPVDHPAGSAADRAPDRRREGAERLALEVSDLYLEQRSVADTLQRALLPQRLPAIPGVEIAVRYVAGASGVDIGGDWCDVVQLDDHRFVFIVDDVSGRGVRAAAVMAALQFAGRAYAQEGYSPAMILERLSRSVDIERDDHFATVLCGLADVTARTLVLASAGHLPPPILSGGDARFAAIKSGPPVGLARKVPLAQA